MTYWGAYKDQVFNTILDQEKSEKNLKYYKNQLFYYIILYGSVFSPIAIAPGIYASYKTGFFDLLFLNFAALIALIVLAFFKPLSIEIRKLVFISLLYSISWSLLLNLKLEGPGMIYLFTTTVVACLIYSGRVAYSIIFLNAIVLLFMGVNTSYKIVNLSITQDQSVTVWFGIVSNLIFLSILIVASLEIIFSKLEKIIILQQSLNDKINSDNLKMHNAQLILEAKNEELNQFAHTIAHDLKEPLRSMQAFSQLVISKYSTNIPEKGQEFLRHIKTSSERMAKLLDALLEYAQLGKGKHVSHFSVDKLVRELEKDLSQLIKENNAQITYDSLLAINGYELEFKQLLQNLLANSIKFKKDDEQVKITVSAVEKPEFYEFIIADNGIGIDANSKEKIFTIFHRLHKNRFPGTGLGLANCKKIVEMHGGEIWVESILNEGSDFHFTIRKDLKNKEADAKEKNTQ